MTVRTLLLAVGLLLLPNLHANSPDETILILYNHGTSGENDCKRFPSEYRQLPKWARRIRGSDIDGINGIRYRVEVKFVCSNESPGSYDSDRAACDLGVCKRVRNIASVIEEYARTYPRRQIFVAGHSAGAWSSLLIKRHSPASINGLILTAPAFGGKRLERTCESPKCTANEGPALRRMIVRAHHNKHLAGTGSTGYPVLDALVVGFPCDAYGWPSELPLGLRQRVDLGIFPPVEEPGSALNCGARAADRYYNGQRVRFCDKLANRNLDRDPACSAERIAYCPERFRKLCDEKSHLFHDDFKKKFPWVLRPPVFSDWFLEEKMVQNFIKDQLVNWAYGKGLPIRGDPCGFMAELSLCRGGNASDQQNGGFLTRSPNQVVAVFSIF